MVISVKQNLFGIQLKMLRIVGMSLQEKENRIYNMYSLFMISGILTLPFFQMYSTFMNLDKFENLIENLVFNTCYSIASLKILDFLLVRAKLKKILPTLWKGVFVESKTAKGIKQHQVVEDGMLFIHTEAIVLCTMVIIFGLSANIELLSRITSQSSSSNWRLPFGDFSTLNVSYHYNFYIAWAYQCVYVSVGCLTYCSIDIFIVAVMAYLSFQCKALQALIKTSVSRSHLESVQSQQNKKVDVFITLHSSHMAWKRLQNVLKEVVQYHMSLITVTTEFENLFYIQTLIDFFGFSLIICLALFYSTLMESFNFRLLQQVTLAGGAIVLQLTLAYWGNEVTLQNFAIGQACSEVDFTGTDVRFQKALSLVIHRTQIPVQFSVGKFSPLTLRTFLVVMKATYSYYMLLHSFSK